jgi:hypothetical protein
VEVRNEGPSAFVLVSEYEQKPSVLRYELPYIIENRCFEHTFRFRQIAAVNFTEPIPSNSLFPDLCLFTHIGLVFA